MTPWDPNLLPIPHSWDQEDTDRLPPALKLFALRNLPLKEVKAVGFDMDYTLARYRSPEIDDLAFKKAIRLLVRERDYPMSLLEDAFDPAFSIRGLALDGRHGNLIKVSRERQVVRATHGSRMMSREEIDTVYGRRRVATDAKDFRCIDTLFEIPESALFARLVDRLDEGTIHGKDYLALFHDARWAIDTAHRNGDMKAGILAHREFFIHRDLKLPIALDRWKRAGKKLFLATNSEWSFTDGVLSHMLDGLDEARPSWTDYFDLIVVSTRKPLFFMEHPDPVPVPGQTNAFSGGNADWVEERLGAIGEEILYVGDHIYGDILRSKKTHSWRTLMLIPELEEELKRLEEHGDELRELLRLKAQHRRCERRVSFLKDQLAKSRLRRHELAQRLSSDALHAFDREAASLQKEIAEVGSRAHAHRDEVTRLNHRIEAAFNAVWGPIFRDGEELTRFPDQIQNYACAYTGKISNLHMVDPDSTLFAPTPTLPHERL